MVVAAIRPTPVVVVVVVIVVVAVYTRVQLCLIQLCVRVRRGGLQVDAAGGRLDISQLGGQFLTCLQGLFTLLRSLFSSFLNLTLGRF